MCALGTAVFAIMHVRVKLKVVLLSYFIGFLIRRNFKIIKFFKGLQEELKRWYKQKFKRVQFRNSDEKGFLYFYFKRNS